MGFGNQLDGIGDQLATGQTEAHPRMSHGQAVADTDGAELRRNPSGRPDPLFDLLGDLPQVHVSRNQLAEGIGHAYQRFFQGCFVPAHRVEQAPMGSAFRSFGYRAAV